MAAGKWIGGFLGFITTGPLAALAGFALGSLFDHGLDEVNKPGSEGYNNREYSNAYEAYSGYGSGGYGNGSYGGYGQQHAYEGERNSFMFSLLVLASYIINADGRIMHSEMELVRRLPTSELRYGSEAAGRGNPPQALRTAEAYGHAAVSHGDTGQLSSDTCQHDVRAAPAVAQLPRDDSPGRQSWFLLRRFRH